MNKLLQVVYENALLPLKSCKVRYSPILIIYFCYGFSSFITIGQTFWIKDFLTLSAIELMHLGFWAYAPWTFKLLFAQIIANITIAGNQRKSYIILGALLTLCGSTILVSIANKFMWVNVFGSVYHQLLLAGVLFTIGLVVQDIVADTLCAEIVDHNASPEEIKSEIGTIQILGRTSLMFAFFLSAGLGGYAAQNYNFADLVWVSFVPPIVSMISVLTFKTRVIGNEDHCDSQITILGISIVLVSILSELLHMPYNQEIILVVNLILIGFLFKKLCADMSKSNIQELVLISIMIFAFRINPALGPADQWWLIDVFKFDPQFFGTLSQVSYFFGFLGTWLFSSYLIKKDISWVIMVLALTNAVLFLPEIGLAFGLQDWTLQHFGFGAKTIVLLDTVMDGPASVLIMVPILAIGTYYAPKKHKPVWFSLSACFMNISLSGGILVGKWLNSIFTIERGNYENITYLFVAKLIIIVVLPITTVLICNRYRTINKPIVD